MKKKEVLLCASGASGAIYTQSLIEKLSLLEDCNTYIIFTQTAKEVYNCELDEDYHSLAEKYPNIEFITNNNFFHKFASGTHILDAMIIAPCSMGCLSRIAQGLSSDLISRIADVQIKERRRLILVPREAPYSLIHLNNMVTLTQSGAIILPASPSFYTQPRSISQLVDCFTDRVLASADIKPISEHNTW